MTYRLYNVDHHRLGTERHPSVRSAGDRRCKGDRVTVEFLHS
ncbi:MAG: hypothetical protein ABSH29_26330 [Acidimicrobiales bacterium]